MIAGSYIFVCAHGSRDVRCGVCGPILIDKLNEEIQLRGLKDQISIMACSHIGGHKYAGNLITFSPGPDGKIMGHWYGYVTPNDVPALLDQHIAKGEVIQKLWSSFFLLFTTKLQLQFMIMDSRVVHSHVEEENNEPQQVTLGAEENHSPNHEKKSVLNKVKTKAKKIKDN